MTNVTGDVSLDRVFRTGSCGTWWLAATAAGYPLGLLHLAPSLVASPAARARAAASVAAVRAANPSGVARTTELMIEAGRAWLAMAQPPAVTAAQVLAGDARLSAGCAAGIAADVAYALRRLHSVGLAHGDLTAHTVALTANGTAALVEVGLLAAVREAPVDVGRDARAWAVLARQLALAVEPVAAESVAVGARTPEAAAADGAAAEAAALRRAAAIADLGDLTTAVRQLARAASDLVDFDDRESLVAYVSRAAAGGVDSVTAGNPQESTVDVSDDGVRLRFGDGVPDAALAATDTAAAAPRQRRGGWFHPARLARIWPGRRAPARSPAHVDSPA